MRWNFPILIKKWNYPIEMMIYCNECGKHFDIVVTSKGSRKYRCPACGEVHAFDLEVFMNKALEQATRCLEKRAEVAVFDSNLFVAA